MALYQQYPLRQIIMRRTMVVVVGTLVLPVMLLRHARAKFDSYLHRIWCKTSTQPAWLAPSESAGGDFW